uniref:Major facilitator superfamily domain containing 2B n=1 Tax=Monodelphis domestica TaxID=13616 RepID=A0A5F8G5I3_MONDO
MGSNLVSDYVTPPSTQVLSTASSLCLPSYRSMLPDAMDDFQLKNPSCQNLEVFFYSFYIFVNKFGGGLALGISTLSLHFAGYQAGNCEPNPLVKLILRVLMAPVPITLLITGLTIFCFYPIDEERRKENRAKMEAASSGLGGTDSESSENKKRKQYELEKCQGASQRR